MQEEKEKVMIAEQKRLVTKEEAETIMHVRQNRDLKKGAFILYGVIFFCSVVEYILFASDGEKEVGCQFFLMNHVCFGVVLLAALASVSLYMKKIGRLIETNQLYVREAIYDGTNRDHDGFFWIKEKGEEKYYGCKVAVREDMNPGEKVLLLEFKDRVTWVYKARP